MKDTIKVSIVTTTYNQEEYISEALDSFVSQKTDFKFEILISDDKSTDETPNIIRKYAELHPDLIKPIYRDKNVGIAANFMATMSSAVGEYIALCEGDDYWTDDNKLQKQADFLDANHDCSLCFHPVKVFFEGNLAKDYVYPDAEDEAKFTVPELLKQNFIQTNSVMYRRQDYSKVPTNILPLDWYLHLYHARLGKIGFINYVMAAYRRHEGGIWWANDRKEFWEKNGMSQLNMYDQALRLFEKEPYLKNILYKTISEAFLSIATIDKPALLQDTVEKFPEMASKSLSIIGQENKRLQQKLSTQTEKLAILNEQVASLDKNGSHQQKLIEEQNEIIVTLQKTNDEIINSKGWQAYTKARNVKSRLKGNHNKNG